jgi:cytosine permease
VRKNEEIWPWEDKYGDYALVPVPGGERRGLLTIFYTFTGVLACIAALWGGGVLGTQFYLKDAILVAIVGSAILSLVGGLVAPIGAVSRCSTYVNLKYPYGHLGSQVWGTILSGIPALGWFAVQTWLFGIMLNTLFPGEWWSAIWVASIWGGLLMLSTAYYGFRAIAVLSYLVVPFFMLLVGFGIAVGIHLGGGFAGLARITPISPVPFDVGVTAVVGMYIVGAIIVADISRFAVKIWDGAAAWIIQIMVFQVYILSGAAMLTLVTGATDVAGALLAAGAGIGAFLMVFLGQWTTNDSNMYVTSLALNLWIPIKRHHIVLGAGVIGVAIAALIGGIWGGAMAPFIEFLLLLGRIIPAIGGVLIADFWLYRWYKGERLRERYQLKPGIKFARVNWVGWISTIVATILGGWIIPWGIAALNVFMLGVVFYVVIAIICDKTNVKIGLGEHIIDKTGR